MTEANEKKNLTSYDFKKSAVVYACGVENKDVQNDRGVPVEETPIAGILSSNLTPDRSNDR